MYMRRLIPTANFHCSQIVRRAERDARRVHARELDFAFPRRDESDRTCDFEMDICIINASEIEPGSIHIRGKDARTETERGKHAHIHTHAESWWLLNVNQSSALRDKTSVSAKHKKGDAWTSRFLPSQAKAQKTSSSELASGCDPAAASDSKCMGTEHRAVQQRSEKSAHAHSESTLLRHMTARRISCSNPSCMRSSASSTRGQSEGAINLLTRERNTQRSQCKTDKEERSHRKCPIESSVMKRSTSSCE